MAFFRIPRIVQWFYREKRWKGEDEGSVYITFDDGPDESTTPWVLDLLKEHGITATFFCTGKNVTLYPELYKTILSNGHTVGNHTFGHEKGSKTSTNEYTESIQRTDDLIQSRLFRPPYGSLTKGQLEKIKSLKKEIVMWTWISHDYDYRVSSKKIIRKAKSIKSRDILLFHNNKKSEKNLKESLPEIIKLVQSKGLEFKPLIS